MMRKEIFGPSKQLKGLVKYYLIAHFFTAKGTRSLIKPYPPSGLQYLSFFLREPVSICSGSFFKAFALPHNFIVGPQSTRADLKFMGEILFFGIVFWPGGLHCILNIPMTQLHNKACNANEVLGKDIDLLAEQLAEKNNYPAMVATAENYLVKKISVNNMISRPIDHILPLILQNSEYRSIDKLIASSCLSTRQFERTFLNRIGMPANHYLKVIRFSEAYKLKEGSPELSWADVAFKCGYFDYAHMVKDFVEFARLTPPALHEFDTAHPEKVYTAFP